MWLNKISGLKMKTASLWLAATGSSNSREERGNKEKEKEKERKTAANSTLTRVEHQKAKEKGKEKAKAFMAKMESGMNQHLMQQLISEKAVRAKVKVSLIKEKVKVANPKARIPKVPSHHNKPQHRHQPRQRMRLLTKLGKHQNGIGQEVTGMAGQPMMMSTMEIGHKEVTTWITGIHTLQRSALLQDQCKRYSAREVGMKFNARPCTRV